MMLYIAPETVRMGLAEPDVHPATAPDRSPERPTPHAGPTPRTERMVTQQRPLATRRAHRGGHRRPHRRLPGRFSTVSPYAGARSSIHTRCRRLAGRRRRHRDSNRRRPMAEVLLFHHAQGLTPGVRAFADDLRAAGHTVHTPDLFDGRTFDTIDEGMAFIEETGFDALRERGVHRPTTCRRRSCTRGSRSVSCPPSSWPRPDRVRAARCCSTPACRSAASGPSGRGRTGFRSRSTAWTPIRSSSARAMSRPPARSSRRPRTLSCSCTRRPALLRRQLAALVRRRRDRAPHPTRARVPRPRLTARRSIRARSGQHGTGDRRARSPRRPHGVGRVATCAGPPGSPRARSCRWGAAHGDLGDGQARPGSGRSRATGGLGGGRGTQRLAVPARRRRSRPSGSGTAGSRRCSS